MYTFCTTCPIHYSTYFLNSQNHAWNVFVLGIKSELQIAIMWSFFFFFLAPWIWQALFFSVGWCSYQLNSQSSTNILLAASGMFTSITSSWTSVSHCTTTEPVLNVKQWATRAHINLASEARVLTYLVLAGVTVPLGMMEVAVKQVLHFFFLRICKWSFLSHLL